MIITINYVWAALGQWNCSHEPSSHLYDNWSQKLVKLSVPENPKVNSATVLFPCKLDKLKIYAAINLDIEKTFEYISFYSPGWYLSQSPLKGVVRSDPCKACEWSLLNTVRIDMTLTKYTVNRYTSIWK